MKIAAQESSKFRRALRSEPVILFTVSNFTFAIAAGAVQEIRSTDSLAGSATEIDQHEVPKVRHSFERAHRTYFVVDAATHFHLPASRPSLVLILRQVRAAVLVDRIERMADISSVYPVPRGFVGDERRWYRGLIYLDDRVLPIVQPSGFLTADEFTLLDRLVSASGQSDLALAGKPEGWVPR
jgi:chemotaxis signal transduction protein